jgi:hypothetical protein
MNTFLETHIEGIPCLSKNTSINFKFLLDRFEIQYGGILANKNTIVFQDNDIIEVGLNQEKYRSSGKAAAGAIVGGVLTGGIGLLAGAALGGKRRTENQLHLILNFQGKEVLVSIKPSKNIPKIYEELKNLMNRADKKQIEDSPKDIASELEKLHGLLQKGILTQEEFDTQKSKILNG